MNDLKITLHKYKACKTHSTPSAMPAEFLQRKFRSVNKQAIILYKK